MGDGYTEQKVRIYKVKKKDDGGKFSKYMVRPMQKILGLGGKKKQPDQKRDRLTA